MIDPNSNATKVQPSFSHNARSFIVARSIDDRSRSADFDQAELATALRGRSDLVAVW
jgi:hypothetical protein